LVAVTSGNIVVFIVLRRALDVQKMRPICTKKESKMETRLLYVIAGLFLFGLTYNAFVAWLERQGHDRGYTAFLVVGGTLVTLGGLWAVTDLDTAILAIICFAASGLPMILGSVWRHMVERASEEEKIMALAHEIVDRWPYESQRGMSLAEEGGGVHLERGANQRS
jgi:hypothetical protein